MIKLAAIDLDGTLYDRHLRVSQHNRAALNEWVASGRQLAIASGRMIPRVDKLLRDDLQVPGYKMCLNGAMVYAPDGKVIAAHPMGKSTLLHVMFIARRYGVRIRFYGELYHVLFSPGHRTTYYGGELTDDVTVATVGELRDLLQRPDIDIYKFTVESVWGNIPALFRARRALMLQPLAMTRSKPLLYEGTAKGVNKLAGLRAICRHAGIDMAESMSFGDQLNDLEMVQGAGVGVAMGNAVREVRQAADVITGRNTASGVAQMLRHEMKVD
ncbi:HAD family hydrolase [Lacticaseibacillus pabuli]|uniref:HAD family hydrolase n=1 Tax=Lacticaseibacillus pabuli TaxID=3025672 RepID=A0ABY7WPA5_9LACO|nr:HAD family hydrolase [Lacticaseibacillus sp. KACC 23028]WDF82032.1 HAD family hydrolase [Lacticaseibacillus sp. KACC 23028]